MCDVAEYCDHYEFCLQILNCVMTSLGNGK